MYEEVQVLTHSSIRIAGNQIIYFDPFNVEGEPHDADIICVTHDHFDHYSPEDLAKVKNAATILVCPKTMKDALSNSGISEEFTELVAPGDEMEINGVRIQAVPAYNVGKQFHPQANQWVGYLVTPSRCPCPHPWLAAGAPASRGRKAGLPRCSHGSTLRGHGSSVPRSLH